MSAPMEIPRFRQKLSEWYRQNRRKLPWRGGTDPYAIWVSEVMLQQTQVRTVVPYYRRFMARFPNVVELAAADLEAVLKCWEGLGYYGRARNLHHAARTVATDLGGVIPRNPADFRQLKGVGEYIASAVMSIAFGEPLAVVDGNVKRVLARLHRIDAPVNRPASHRLFRQKAEELLDRGDPGTFNQALMELGALVCRPRRPLCPSCPVRRFCGAHAAGTVEDYPGRVRREPVPCHAIAVGVVVKKARLLITRRKPEGLLGGLWEFPGGKLKKGEAPEAACIREIAEETGLKVSVSSHLTRVRHAYTHFRIVMDVYICRHLEGEVVLNGPQDYRWITLEAMERHPFPRANHKFIPLLRERLSRRA